MELTQITYFIFKLIPLVDNKRYEQISFEEMKTAMDNKEVFELLEREFTDSVDFSLFTPEIKEEISEELWQIYGGQLGREKRKYSVENNGICLLIGYLVEIIQQNLR